MSLLLLKVTSLVAKRRLSGLIGSNIYRKSKPFNSG